MVKNQAIGEEEHPFYGTEILIDREQRYIKAILQKYQDEPVNEELKKKVWEELQMEKYKGRINIPFKLIMHRDATGKNYEYIEVLLDTKV